MVIVVGPVKVLRHEERQVGVGEGEHEEYTIV
jgi:hypothetical protein